MANGVSKLQLLIELKQKLKAGLDSAKQHVKKATGDMQAKLDAFKTKNIELFNAIKDEVPGVGRALSLLTNPYVLITAAVLSAGIALVKFTGMANKWHEGLAEINVTAGMTQTELGGLSDKLLEIGGRNVAPLEEVPAAFNRIISAGLSVNDSLKTLEPTLRAAKAGFTDIETVAAAAVSTMQSSGQDANRVFDVLFATLNKGNAKFKDIAQYLPKVIPLARTVGLALDETAGAYASLTTKLSAEQSATALQGIMRSLSDKDRVNMLKTIGVDVFDKNTGRVRSFFNIMSDLQKSMSGLTDKQRMLKFGKLGLDQEAVLGFSTLIQDIPNLQKSIDATVNSQGALNKAYDDSLAPMDSWKNILNNLKVGMIKIGDLFLPIVSRIGEKVLGVITYFKELYKESALFRDILAGIGLAFTLSFKLAMIPLKFVANLFKSIWEASSSVLKNLFGITGGISEMYNKIRPYLMWMYELFKQIGNVIYHTVTGSFKDLMIDFATFKMPDLNDIRKRIKIETETTGDFSGVPGKGGEGGDAGQNTNKGNALAETADIIKQGSQTKNITITIDSFIKGFTPTHQSINGMNKDELERWLTEMFLRVVRSAETTI